MFLLQENNGDRLKTLIEEIVSRTRQDKNFVISLAASVFTEVKTNLQKIINLQAQKNPTDNGYYNPSQLKLITCGNQLKQLIKGRK